MRLVKIFSAVITIAMLTSCNSQGVTKKSLDNEVDSVSYAIGLDIVSNLKRGFDEVDQDLLIQGIRNGIDSTNLLIDYDKVANIVRTYMTKKQVEQRKKQQEDALKKAEEEFSEVKTAGEKFLEENKTKDGVKITDSGLQYVVIKEGTGAKPVATNKVKVHYHGTLTDGTVFDSSVDRDKPQEFFANQVIKGWTEGLQLMPVGSKYKFFIPQELAYGAFPRQGGKIRPFDTLVFEVELLEIVK